MFASPARRPAAAARLEGRAQFQIPRLRQRRQHLYRRQRIRRHAEARRRSPRRVTGDAHHACECGEVCAPFTARSQQGESRIGGHRLLLREVEVGDVAGVVHGASSDGAGLCRLKYSGTQFFHLRSCLCFRVRDSNIRDGRDDGGSHARLLGHVGLPSRHHGATAAADSR